jgi:hypothetical protein
VHAVPARYVRKASIYKVGSTTSTANSRPQYRHLCMYVCMRTGTEFCKPHIVLIGVACLQGAVGHARARAFHVQTPLVPQECSVLAARIPRLELASRCGNRTPSRLWYVSRVCCKVICAWCWIICAYSVGVQVNQDVAAEPPASCGTSHVSAARENDLYYAITTLHHHR